MCGKYAGFIIVIDFLALIYSSFQFSIFLSSWYEIEKTFGKTFVVVCVSVCSIRLFVAFFTFLLDLMTLCKSLFYLRITLKCILYCLSVFFVLYLWLWYDEMGFFFLVCILICIFITTLKLEKQNWLAIIKEKTLITALARYEPLVIRIQGQSQILYPNIPFNETQYQQNQTSGKSQIKHLNEPQPELKIGEQNQAT